MLLKHLYFLLLLLVGTAAVTYAQQWKLKGTLYDISKKIPLDGVSVMSTSGAGTATDSMGNYTITVKSGDSVWFSYLGKPTAKYAVDKLQDQTQFNYSLHVYSQALPMAFVRARSYRNDSLENRQTYAKVFNFNKPNPLNSINIGAGGVGMDPNEIINMFRFKRNRSILALQNRLLEEEQTKFVDYRFSKTIIKKLTGMSPEQITVFMNKYRPSYEFTAMANDLEFYNYILQCYKRAKALGEI